MKHRLKKIIGFSLSMVFIYLFLLVNPNSLFAHKYEYRNFKVYADQAITENIDFVIDDAISRLEKSDLYEATDQFDVYLCNDSWRFRFFTRNGNAGGVVNFLISPNIFIRESSIETNQIIPPGGWMYSREDRPLSYFIAHEAVHSLQRKHNTFLQFSTPPFILEGYADYIAKKPNFDYERYEKLYLENDPMMNPQSGLYLRYHLYVAYLIEKKSYSFFDIIEEQPDLEKTLKLCLEE